MPQLITTRKELTKLQQSYRGKKVAFVPTMGALHEGHLSLVEIAKKHAEIVWVSIFVNPLQFGPSEDFSKYPRTLDNDIAMLTTLGVDYIWAPSVEEMYGETVNGERSTVKADPELTNRLCGLNRPGHFDGVCTVVKLLFDLIQPDVAVFGEKDYQQLMVIREMVSRLKLPVEIIGAPILREASGLAMSSRNRYLSAAERKVADNIYQNLYYLSSLNSISEQDLKQAKTKLEELGMSVDYLEMHWGRIFVAAKVGSTRLIDNVKIKDGL
jgi:pantoate--beta-alanine ligase